MSLHAGYTSTHPVKTGQPQANSEFKIQNFEVINVNRTTKVIEK